MKNNTIKEYEMELHVVKDGILLYLSSLCGFLYY